MNKIKNFVQRYSGAIALVVMLLFMGTISEFPQGYGRSPSVVFTTTSANSQVDTINYSVEPNVSALTFVIERQESTKVGPITVRRWGLSYESPVRAGDTLVVLDSSTTTYNRIATVTITPVSNKLQFIIPYGTTKNGVTAPTTVYALQKQYAY